MKASVLSFCFRFVFFFFFLPLRCASRRCFPSHDPIGRKMSIELALGSVAASFVACILLGEFAVSTQCPS